MVLLLSILPVVLVAALLHGLWKTRNPWFILAIVILFYLYPKIQPSYLPKGDVVRSEVPAFTSSGAEIKDSARKPVPSDERNAAQKAEYEKGLDFIN